VVRQRRLHDPDPHRESNLLDFHAAMLGNRAHVSIRMRRRGLSLLYIKNTRRVTEARRSSRTEYPIDRHGIIYFLQCYLPHSKPVLEDEYDAHQVKNAMCKLIVRTWKGRAIYKCCIKDPTNISASPIVSSHKKIIIVITEYMA
jgi:hypothetical protein